ncbi:Transmembrane domain-containing protein [Spironucleus salmonicida]|uniref:Transmembrane domain-containing protein n=1 Tax=Spironucleus salmonicida TaxID=348837 RepID=V6LKZ0_9EUKA|nr:Transmembrane domain-containing protein [Spironucleus salmonicida]|eukprot:EST45033.1 Transmembrane domain-containing protein [Spironucleus salmonicida]
MLPARTPGNHTNTPHILTQQPAQYNVQSNGQQQMRLMPSQSQYEPSYVPQVQQQIVQQDQYPQVQFSQLNYAPQPQTFQQYQPQIQQPVQQQIQYQQQYQQQPPQFNQQHMQQPVLYQPQINQNTNNQQLQYQTQVTHHAPEYIPNQQNQPFKIQQPIQNIQDKYIPSVLNATKSQQEEFYNIKSKTFYEFLVFGHPKISSQLEVQQEIYRATGVQPDFVRQTNQGLIYQVENPNDLVQIYEKTPFTFNGNDRQLCGVTKEPICVEDVKFQTASVPARQAPFIGFWIILISLFVLWSTFFGKETVDNGIIYLVISLILTLVVAISIVGYWLIKK